MKIRLYMDYFSQPSRAVYTLLQLTKTPHEIIQTRVIDKQNKTPQYLQMNPHGTVPCIYDPQNQLTLNQSHTIMRYICSKYPEAAKNWYPQQDYILRSQIDEYLDFHHTQTRKCHYYISNKLFSKNGKGVVDEQFVEKYARRNVDVVLDKIQQCFFRSGERKYLVGNQPSLADLSGFFEIQFLLLAGEDFTKWPLIKRWMMKMKEFDQIKEANKIFVKLLPRINPNYSKQLV